MRPGNREDKPRLAQFGEPDLKATTAIARRLVERYVYLIAKDRATVIVLADAEVVGVSTDPAHPQIHKIGPVRQPDERTFSGRHRRREPAKIRSST